jgi:hypothetical protein
MADISKLVAENIEVLRQRTEPKERQPDEGQRSRERAGDSTWSGASGGGGVWAGRSIHE